MVGGKKKEADCFWSLLKTLPRSEFGKMDESDFGAGNPSDPWSLKKKFTFSKAPKRNKRQQSSDFSTGANTIGLAVCVVSL